VAIEAIGCFILYRVLHSIAVPKNLGLLLSCEIKETTGLPILDLDDPEIGIE
jgi:hypothetical protein